MTDILRERDLAVEDYNADGNPHDRRSGARITHKPTGITVECHANASLIRNRAACLQTLRRLLRSQSAGCRLKVDLTTSDFVSSAEDHVVVQEPDGTVYVGPPTSPALKLGKLLLRFALSAVVPPKTKEKGIRGLVAWWNERDTYRDAYHAHMLNDRELGEVVDENASMKKLVRELFLFLQEKAISNRASGVDEWKWLLAYAQRELGDPHCGRTALMLKPGQILALEKLREMAFKEE